MFGGSGFNRDAFAHVVEVIGTAVPPTKSAISQLFSREPLKSLPAKAEFEAEGSAPRGRAPAACSGILGG